MVTEPLFLARASEFSLKMVTPDTQWHTNMGKTHTLFQITSGNGCSNTAARLSHSHPQICDIPVPVLWVFLGVASLVFCLVEKGCFGSEMLSGLPLKEETLTLVLGMLLRGPGGDRSTDLIDFMRDM